MWLNTLVSGASPFFKSGLLIEQMPLVELNPVATTELEKVARPVTFSSGLKVTGAASLNGGGTVKTPTYAVSDTSLVNASWVWNLIQRYGLSGKASQADILWPSRDLNDIDVTGFYTVASDWKNSPRGEESQNSQEFSFTFKGISMPAPFHGKCACIRLLRTSFFTESKTVVCGLNGSRLLKTMTSFTWLAQRLLLVRRASKITSI